ncbi:hypothetical protein L1987_63044 [Smallanthus sonchifolius]|uniref:Uncharacterized protein n=1 Tax=Smallanthus sonchifolius TaxID=185202 RepID=A0ACB9CC44_9ASTR|nr:hypothetical protein L1987_63044 [Smallanthus sonchifolius]
MDPLFLYIPTIDGTRKCLHKDKNLEIVVCVFRSIADILYVFHIIIKFRTARGPTSYNRIDELDQNVAKRYLLTYGFIIDVLAALPLPQFAVLVLLPNLDGQPVITKESISKENVLKFIVFYQYFPRVIQTSLLYRKVTHIFHNLIDEFAWVRAVCNLLFYVLASHVIGALWYFFALESELRCWHDACKRHNCTSKYFHCEEGHVGDYGFLNTSCPLIERSESRNSTNFDFGIYLEALKTRVLETNDFRKKILYCSLWGLQNLSSLGQGLKPSTFTGETIFVYFIAVMGLFLFALLIGNIQ